MDRLYPIPVLSNKKRCPHLAIHMECNVGGFATAECFHPNFHSDCGFRKKAEKNYPRFPSENSEDVKKEEN